MPSSKSNRAAQLLLELVIVFLGVLIALAADSWRQNRESTQRADSYLSAIASDMAESERILREAKANNEIYLARADSVQSILQGRAQLPDGVADVRAMMQLQADLPGPPMGTLRAVLTTGEISLLRSESVRATLIREYAVIESRLGWIDEVASQSGANISQLILTLGRLEPESGRSGVVLLADLRQSPDLVAYHLIYSSHMRNIVSAQARAIESIERIRDVVAPVSSN